MKFRDFGIKNWKKGELKMTKLVLKTSNLQSLNDGGLDLGALYFDLKQFKVPSAMLVQKEGVAVRVEKEMNANGELVETGKYALTFKVYDRAFIELILQNGGTEIGSPILIVVEGQDSLPILDSYEEGEFIPITFTELKVRPKKVQKKAFVAQGKPMVDTWQYLEIKIEAESYTIGEVNAPKPK